MKQESLLSITAMIKDKIGRLKVLFQLIVTITISRKKIKYIYLRLYFLQTLSGLKFPPFWKFPCFVE